MTMASPGKSLWGVALPPGYDRGVDLRMLLLHALLQYLHWFRSGRRRAVSHRHYVERSMKLVGPGTSQGCSGLRVSLATMT